MVQEAPFSPVQNNNQSQSFRPSDIWYVEDMIVESTRETLTTNPPNTQGASQVVSTFMESSLLVAEALEAQLLLEWTENICKQLSDEEHEQAATLETLNTHVMKTLCIGDMPLNLLIGKQRGESSRTKSIIKTRAQVHIDL